MTYHAVAITFLQYRQFCQRRRVRCFKFTAIFSALPVCPSLPKINRDTLITRAICRIRQKGNNKENTKESVSIDETRGSRGSLNACSTAHARRMCATLSYTFIRTNLRTCIYVYVCMCVCIYVCICVLWKRRRYPHETFETIKIKYGIYGKKRNVYRTHVRHVEKHDLLLT